MRTPLELAKLHGCLRIHLVRVDDPKHTLCSLRIRSRSDLTWSGPAIQWPQTQPTGQAYRVTGTVSACTCLRCFTTLRKGFRIPRLWSQRDPQYRRPA